MVGYFQQFLYGTNEVGNPAEIINGARTLALLQANLSGNFNNVLAYAGCRSLTLEPCTISLTPPTTVTTASWQPLSFAITAAPWYRADVPASSEAFGIIITDWTGLDGEHYARDEMSIGGGRGGAFYGPLGGGARVWKMNVVLHGSTDRGLNYLYRWLEQQLMGCCPSAPLDQPEEGMAAGERVALIEGLKWEAPPIENGCIMRAASFALGVGDPCLYRPVGTTSVTVDGEDPQANGQIVNGALGYPADGFVGGELLGSPCSAWNSSAVDGTGLAATLVLPRATHGKMSAIVTFEFGGGTPGEDYFVPAYRILGFADPAGVGTTDPCLGRLVSDLVITGALPNDVIEVDLGRRRIRHKGGLDSGAWTDASYLAYRSTPYRPWPSFDQCDIGTIRVEPAYSSQFETYELVMIHNWAITIQSQEHVGCPC
jgi:hypothetical protein